MAKAAKSKEKERRKTEKRGRERERKQTTAAERAGLQSMYTILNESDLCELRRSRLALVSAGAQQIRISLGTSLCSGVASLSPSLCVRPACTFT
eukprot:1876078-Pleurochrysis_carterae.AAC.5